jgi:hypothetical protein
MTSHAIIGMLLTQASYNLLIYFPEHTSFADLAIKVQPNVRVSARTRPRPSSNGVPCHHLNSSLAPPHLAMDPSQCSPALNASQGITANPDISGIGVRTAIYTQAVISLIHPLVAGYDGKIDDFEIKSLATVYLGILLPECALLFSAIIQARTFGLSAYHAMIVLFLSWINNTSALTFFTYILGDYVYVRGYRLFKGAERQENRQHEVTELDSEWVEADDVGKWRVLEKVEKMLDRLKSDKNGLKSTSLDRDVWDLEIQQWSLWRKKKIMTMILPNEGDSLEFQRRWDKEWENNKREQDAIFPKDRLGVLNRLYHGLSQKSIWLTGTLATTHLTLLSGFGWWFWSTLPNFGINQECIPSIRFIFFTKSIPMTSAVLRSHSKSIYIFSSLPGINIIIWMNILLWGVVGIEILMGILILILIGIAILPLLPLAGLARLIIRARRKGAPAKVPSSATTSQPVSAEGADSPPETTSPSGAISPNFNAIFNAIFKAIFPRIYFALAIITTLAVQILLITLTELTIAHNQHLIQSREGDWTFGQTLALTLTLIPLIEVVKFLWEKRPRAAKESGESTETRETGWAGETGEAREARESGETREARESGEGRGEVGADGLV